MIDDYFRATIVGRLHGQETNTVLHYRETATGAGDASALLAFAVDAAIGVAMRAWASEEWTYGYTMVQKFDPSPVLMAAINSENTGPGDVTGSSLPSSVAAVITKRTALAGRSFRGRVFLPGVPSSYELDSELTGAAMTATATLADVMILQKTQGGYTWVPIVYTKAELAVPQVWTSYLVRSPLRTQRRREVGKGS